MNFIDKGSDKALYDELTKSLSQEEYEELMKAFNRGGKVKAKGHKGKEGKIPTQVRVKAHTNKDGTLVPEHTTTVYKTPAEAKAIRENGGYLPEDKGGKKKGDKDLDTAPRKKGFEDYLKGRSKEKTEGKGKSTDQQKKSPKNEISDLNDKVKTKGEERLKHWINNGLSSKAKKEIITRLKSGKTREQLLSNLDLNNVSWEKFKDTKVSKELQDGINWFRANLAANKHLSAGNTIDFDKEKINSKDVEADIDFDKQDDNFYVALEDALTTLTDAQEMGNKDASSIGDQNLMKYLVVEDTSKYATVEYYKEDIEKETENPEFREGFKNSLRQMRESLDMKLTQSKEELDRVGTEVKAKAYTSLLNAKSLLDKVTNKWKDICYSFNAWNDKRKAVENELYEKYERERTTGITDEEREEMAKNTLIKRDTVANREEAVKSLRDTGLNFSDDFIEELDDDYVKALANSINSMAEQYPAIREELEGVELKYVNNPNIHMCVETDKNGSTRTLCVGSHYNSYEDLQKAHNSGVASNANPKADGPESRMVHELGHVLVGAICKKRGARNYRACEKIEADLKQKVLDKVFGNKVTFSYEITHGIQKQLGNYAFTSPAEFLAEAFTSLNCGKPTPIANALKEVLAEEGLTKGE